MLVELAGRGGGARVSARRLGETLDIPYPFARRIVTQLAAAGLVDTRRGVGGGVDLARPAADISLRDIVCSLDGPVSLNECTRTPGYCSRGADCPVHEAWQEADGVLDRFLRAKDLASMAAAAGEKRRPPA
jgi:Rrf2 family protein